MEETSLREQKKRRTRVAITNAALQLFAARGFEAVTLADVAAAADIGERTLFRYFPDKEELLFGEDTAVQAQLEAGLAARPADEAPTAAVLEAIVSLAPLWQDRQEEGRVRQAIVAASQALQARERVKHAAYERTLAAGLVRRGTPEPQARLLARTAVACLDEAIARWFADDDPARPGLEARGRETFPELAALLTAPRKPQVDP